ncbi:hypothetical protein NM208_g3888 [Fusarium decemcellulare]|uniref:Uncharacterized protein n=1 Tax=Fusarium decemcellulare TaxID=57161 RepID=A0ACC1SMH6_9HYPO|nr:hypothetical protein NM208_g3888 [Fusarium decemcellulare]
MPNHHPGLDDTGTATVVTDMLHIIAKTICDSAQLRRSRTTRHLDDGRPHGPASASRRQKLAWSLWGKDGCVEQVELFEKLVQELHNLVPPSTEKSEHATSKHVIMEFQFQATRGFLRCARCWLKSNVGFATRREIHAWLGKSSPNDRYQESIQQRVDDTCAWIFDRPSFITWAAPEPMSEPRLLWINGPAGFGKTILCARIVEHLSNSLHTPVAHFFFTSDLESRENPYLALRSWISQIIARDEAAFDHVHKAWEADFDPVASRAAIVKLFKSLIHNVPGCTFIADGLDECAHLSENSTTGGSITSVSRFLSYVIDAVAEADVRVLFVSRDEPEIRHILINDTEECFIEYKIVPEDVRSDTAAFSHSIINRKLSNKSQDLRSTLSQAMTDRCQGQFLWLKMQEESLRRGMNKKRLREVIENTPSGLDRLYEYNWMKITRMGEWERNRAFEILRWVAFARRELTVCEVTEAVLMTQFEELDVDDLPDAVDDDYIKTEIVGLCGPLVEVKVHPDSDFIGHRTVHITHFSVRQYLLGRLPIPSWIQQNHQLQSFYEKSHHTVLAKACLQYLSLLQVWEDQVDQRTQGETLRSYATYSWYPHVEAGFQTNAEIFALSKAFLSKDNPVWHSLFRFFRYRQSPAEFTEQSDQPIITPLQYALGLKWTEMAENLVTRENVNEIGEWGRPAIFLACQKGMADVVAKFLEMGADVATADPDGCTPLGIAAFGGSVDVIKLLLGNGANCAAKNDAGWTALHEAAMRGHAEVCKLLIESGSDMAAATDLGFLPLHTAAGDGQIDVVNLFLEHGADPTTRTNDGLTPLHLASVGGHIQVVDLLLQKGTGTAATDLDGFTPLHLLLASWALQRAGADRAAEVASKLLDEGADMTAKCDDGHTPLIMALTGAPTKVVRVFLERATRDMMTTTALHQGWTPIFLAMHNDNVESARALLERDHDISMTTVVHGYTPLQYASHLGNAGVAKLLLDYGAESTIAAVDNDGATPLRVASIGGHAEVVKVLLEHGAQATVSIVDNFGWPPLCGAATDGYTEVAKLLLDYGAQATTSVAHNDGLTPLYAASCNGHVETVKLLLDHGAQAVISMTDRYGRTPLYAASSNGHAEMVQILLDHGAQASLQIVDEEGWTPLFAASCNGHAQVVQILLEHGAESTIATAAQDGSTPLLAAAMREGDHDDIVGLLLDHGAQTTLQVADEYGWTPLYAASRKGNLHVAKRILGHAAETVHSLLVATTNFGSTPLLSASEDGRAEMVKLLLDYGAETTINIANKGGRRPLDAAAEEGHAEVVKLLLRVPQVDANLENCYGQTPLFFASRLGDAEVVTLLLSQDSVNPDSKDWMGSSPLFSAVVNGHLEVVKLLIGRGAAVEPWAAVGCSLLWWARRAGNLEIIQLLEEKGHKPSVSRSDDVTRYDPPPSDAVSVPFDAEMGWCYVCTLNVQNGQGYYCVECEDTGLLLCAECFDRGFAFCIKSHALVSE